MNSLTWFNSSEHLKNPLRQTYQITRRKNSIGIKNLNLLFSRAQLQKEKKKLI